MTRHYMLIARWPLFSYSLWLVFARAYSDLADHTWAPSKVFSEQRNHAVHGNS